jgi:hypothetical protein
MSDTNFKEKQRITQFQKNKFGRQYYKDQVDMLDIRSYNNTNYATEENNVSRYKQKKVNYDLFNNIVSLSDFEYVCKPYGAEQGELPANLTNRDIVSGKIKALLGMEEKRPFSYKVVATNDEATTRIENEKFERIKQFVIKSIMDPIQAQIQMQKMQQMQQQMQGQEIPPEQLQQMQQQVQQEIAQETEAMTPPEVLNYMKRVHQDPAEALAEQLLNYLKKKLDFKRKFNKGFKHACIAGEEIYHIGIINGEPNMTVVNPLYFDYDKSPDVDFIEDGEWAVCEYRMTPSQIITMFGNELKSNEIDDLYTAYGKGPSSFTEEFWSFDNDSADGTDDTIRVVHVVWKGLRKIGFLEYTDIEGNLQEQIVDESYKLDKEAGDLSITWRWIPEVHQGYKIKLSNPIYVGLGPVEGQFKDMDNIYECKLPYFGLAYDNLNSETTSMVDRIKAYQYYYNIIMYRIELLMASDKGKILMMNINSIPKTAGIDIKKWHYYAEATKVAWVNPNEEGNRNTDISQINRVLDMSLASDINNYINLASYIERKAGEAIGIPKEMEAQINTQQSVGNVRQTIMQASNILEPLFEMHNYVKRNVIERLLEVAKEAYSGSKSKMLRYVLDDLSIGMLQLDTEMLSNSTYGITVASSSLAHEAKELVKQMAHAGIQNQMINMSDIIKIVKSDGLQEAEDHLKVAEETKRKQMDEQQTKIKQIEQQMQQEQIQARQKEKEFDRETQILLADKKHAADLQRQTILSMGFSEDKDVDRDGKPDILEVAQHGLDAEIMVRKQNLDEQKFAHQKKVDEQKMKIAKEKDKNKK